MAILRKVQILAQPDGEWSIDNGRTIKFVKTANDVGSELEEMLWPLLELGLREKRDISILVNY